MSNEKTLGKDVEAFSRVVDALLINPRTQIEFKKDPLLTLKNHGIDFVNPEVGKEIEKELRETPEFASGEMVAYTSPLVKVATKSTSPVVSVAVSVASQASKLEVENTFKIDKDRVGAFLYEANLLERIVNLEAEVTRLSNLLK